MNFNDDKLVLNQSIRKYKKEVQKLLKYCKNCQPRGEGEYVWILGDETILDEIFELVNCPVKYRDEMVQHVSCSNCGSSFLSRWDSVGLEDAYTPRAEKHYETALKKYEKKIYSFLEHLKLYPSLALHHSLGGNIFNEIINNKSNALNINVNGWYRAREVKKSQVYTINDMGAPPVGKSSGGRFHHSGQSVLYLSDTKDVAITEALNEPTKNSLIWIQNYLLNGSLENVLDLRYDWDNFSQLTNNLMAALLASGAVFEMVENRESNWKPQYFITQFISDSARLAGYNGILYSSTRDSGFNLVVFNNLEQFVPEGEPKILVHEVNEFHDFSSIDDLLNLE